MADEYLKRATKLLEVSRAFDNQHFLVEAQLCATLYLAEKLEEVLEILRRTDD